MFLKKCNSRSVSGGGHCKNVSGIGEISRNAFNAGLLLSPASVLDLKLKFGNQCLLPGKLFCEFTSRCLSSLFFLLVSFRSDQKQFRLSFTVLKLRFELTQVMLSNIALILQRTCCPVLCTSCRRFEQSHCAFPLKTALHSFCKCGLFRINICVQNFFKKRN